MNALDIELAVVQYINPRTKLIVPNVSWGFGVHECDLLVITDKNYLYEIEIKISKSDLLADKKKKHTHHDSRIKRLYFAIPIELKDCVPYIPEHAGVFFVRFNGSRHICSLHRKAKDKSEYTVTAEDKYKLARLGAMRIWALKQKIQKIKRN